MAVRLADVAKEAGVSQATASRVLNGSKRKPSEEIADRVRSAAERLGYFPNAQAQALARSTAGLVGLIVHDIADPYFSSIARGVQHGLDGTGVQLLLSSTGRDPDVELGAVRSFLSHRTDAILLAGSRGMSGDDELAAALTRYQENGGKVVMIGQPLALAGGIQLDNQGAAAELAQELLKLGHRRFAVLSGDQSLATARDRVSGFVEKLESSGIAPVVVREGAFTRDGGYLEMADLLRSNDLDLESGQVCVFCANDVMALGAMTAIRESGLRVPEDVAVAGFDDIPTLGDLVPSVTTVRLPLEEIGRMAGEFVLADGDDQRRFVVSGHPVLRESTRKV
ncbi:LacI family DNA-binding transcriptional regulator [Zhihengliuella salsuginis]|uniref:LacI family transcriptional regulator n=1 Tax=Zhihengliuella salsuginis TaxID=578222 RepID=A0ABQ3GHG4_9MICC|nr:LacI family DNA-binding transcriptional regulator [Zhihengliuella salsuginis]GHD06907.1 LacI family transcriptional regulator [Zhihengliuella salsuginis]